MGFTLGKQGAEQAVSDTGVATLVEIEEEISRRVRHEVSRILPKVEAEAVARGEAEGRAELAQEHNALASALLTLKETAGQLAAPLAKKEADLAELVIELAFILAHHVIGVEVSTRPASLLKLVNEVIAEATDEKSPRQSIILRLNPADYAHLRPLISEDVAIIEPSESIAQGGAVVEIVSPDGDPFNKVEWDATLRSRIGHLRDALGQDGQSIGGFN